MKVLMPFKIHDGKSIYDTKVMGGLERFAQLLLKNSMHEIIPFEITEKIRKDGNAAKLIIQAAKLNYADVILTNYDTPTYSTNLVTGEFPVVWIWHTAADGSIGRIKVVKDMKNFVDAGGHLYFVSKHQHDKFNAISMRILGHPVNGVRGYVNPAFCEGFEQYNPNEPVYDAITIGRTSYMKDPFWVHNKLKNSSLTSAVITTGGHHLESPNEKKYYEDNLNWIEPRTVFRDLNHREVLDVMSRGSVFISTWPLETWGITTLESLSYGLPTILLTDNTLHHASEMIAADPSHIRCIPKSTKPEELEKVILELKNYSVDKRKQIAIMTHEKHSRDAFMKMYDTVFTDALNAGVRKTIFDDLWS